MGLGYRLERLSTPTQTPELGDDSAKDSPATGGAVLSFGCTTLQKIDQPCLCGRDTHYLLSSDCGKPTSPTERQEMNTYEITVRFTTDRQLTEEEKGTLQMQVIAQVEEPANEEGDDVTYSTAEIYISDIDEVNN